MSLLSTSTSALMAFQRALNTTGHNIANLKTPGYSRQSVSFASQGSTRYSFGQVGNGVNIVDIRRDADILANSRLLDSTGEMARLHQLSVSANRLDTLFSDKATNIAGAWSNFFDAASALAADASSTPQRQQLIDSAHALSTRFHQLDGELVKMEDEINARLRASSDEINRLSHDIADLNSKIGSNAAAVSPDVLDRRDQLVSQLVEITGGTAIAQDGAQLNVLTAGGHALVVGTHATAVTTIADPYQPGRLHLAMRSQGQEVRMDDKTFGGQIGGMFEFRREVLDPARADLGRLAVGLSERFNSAHRQGVDLSGAPGGDVFTHAAPHVLAHSGNTGNAEFSAHYRDSAALTGKNVELYFDGNTWNARDPDTGVGIALTGSGSAGDPLRVGGIGLTINGSAKQGDTFLLQPTSGVAGSLGVAISDPAKIAAAAPFQVAASLDNKGTAKASLNITAGAVPGTIEFISANEYTIDGQGPFGFVPGEPIQGKGWDITLVGEPASGDTFTVSQTGANSSDNHNAQRLAGVDAGGFFAGGSVSLKAAVSGLTASIGSAARDAEAEVNAQSLLHSQAQSARDAISGVDINEEGANVLQLQQAYQAAAQLISTADTLFQTILNATRG